MLNLVFVTFTELISPILNKPLVLARITLSRLKCWVNVPSGISFGGAYGIAGTVTVIAGRSTAKPGKTDWINFLQPVKAAMVITKINTTVRIDFFMQQMLMIAG